MQELQLECDVQADKVIRTCMEKRGLKALCARVAGRNRDKEGQPACDPQEISSVLDELVTPANSPMCSYACSSYSPSPSPCPRPRLLRLSIVLGSIN